MVIESTDMDEISEGENVEQEERTTQNRTLTPNI